MTNAHVKPLLLVVDDDPSIRSGLDALLTDAGYAVLTAEDGDVAAELLVKRFDLVLTDLAMPRVDGFCLLARIRAESAVPVIVLSVRGADADKVRALDLGADDYVVKPFSSDELLARVRAQLRRAGSNVEPPASVLRFDGLVLDRVRRQVEAGGVPVKMTPIEFALLELLAANAGKPVTTARILAAVWPGRATSPDTLRVHIGTLRKKIEPTPSRPRFIATEPWVGYRFLAEPLP